MRRSCDDLLLYPSCDDACTAVDQCFFVRTLGDLAADHEQEKQTENEVETNESNQGEDSIAVTYNFAVAVAGVKEAIGQPRLTSQLRCHPANGISDVWEWKCEHQHPKQPCAGLQPATPSLEGGKPHEKDEDRSQRDHQVKGVVQKFDIVRPCVRRILIQSVH